MAPHRIHLLLGVPLDWPAFERATQDPARDWLRDCRADPRHHWQAHYDLLVASPLRQLAADAQDLGVPVRPEATLADLAAASAAGEVVIVLAHWKAETPGDADLAPSGTDHEAQALATELSQRLMREPGLHTLAAQLARATSRTHIMALLEHHVQAGPAEATRGDFEERAHPATRAAQRRSRLDALLHPLLRPGNRLELADGLHGAAEVEAALAEPYDGVLDLTCCQGRTLADHVDRQRLGECRVVQFEQDLVPDLAALALLRTLQRCTLGGEPYLAARDAALHETHAALLRAAAGQPDAPASWWQRVRDWARA